MLKGGYKIIDLKGTNITPATAVTIKGVHRAIEVSYGKALLLAGIVISSVEYNDTYITYTVDSGSYKIANVYGYNITITAEDKVTFTAVTTQ